MGDFMIRDGVLWKFSGWYEEVTIPAGVTRIGPEAFRHCFKLKSVTIPAGVTCIGREAFKDCNKLENVTIPAGMLSIGKGAFSGCVNLKEITVPAGVTDIGEGAFSGCENLMRITAPDSVKSIGARAFCNCMQLRDITIPAGVTGIGPETFRCCFNLKNITISDSVTSIGEKAFTACCAVEHITIPARVTEIGPGAFKHCSLLKSVTIRASVTEIGPDTFSECESLTDITIPEGVRDIGALAFSDCRSLTDIIIPESVTHIDDTAFLRCPLQQVSISPDLLKNTASPELWPAADIPAETLFRIMNSCPEKCIKKTEDRILKDISLEAVRFCYERRRLDAYTALHQKDRKAVIDRLSDELGLDARGTRRLIAGDTYYTATLRPDLTFVLTDETGKTVRTVPKNTPEDKAAAEEFAALQVYIKAAARLRSEMIFSDFLSGNACPASDWKENRIHRLLLKWLALRVVWSQNGNTFILHDDGNAYDVNGVPYIISKEEIRVAHPMEMGPTLTKQWQDYFITNGVKQPFEQVWEPVIDESYVKSDRYDHCFVSKNALMNKTKHGIKLGGKERITLKGCSADVSVIRHKDGYNNEYTVRNFKFMTYTRQVNHIVSILDKETVAGRIPKDDVTVQQWLDSFTLPQIMEFIELANTSKASNVAALLLDYKEKHFSAFDPMAEFILDF